jgi:hypothetical protein
MMTVVDKLPDHVSMPPFFQDKVRKRKEGKRKFKYLQVTHSGRAFYIPITKEVWEAFSLNQELRNKDGDICWENGKIDRAICDIVGAILLQVRDEVLGGLGIGLKSFGKGTLP